MKLVIKSTLAVMASACAAVSPAAAGAGGAGTPFPVAGLAILGVAGLVYAGRVMRRMR